MVAAVAAAAALPNAYERLCKTVGGSRQLRAACPRLFRDVLAVMSGLRSGCMVDYAPLTPGQLAAGTASLAAALQMATAGLCVLELVECAYLVRPRLLAWLVNGADAAQQEEQQQQPGSAPPLMLAAFDGSQRVRWAAGAEAAAAVSQLDALRNGLLLALEQAGCGIKGSIPVLRAADIPGWRELVPPTASGYLLGYPAVYLCHSLEGAQAASRCLSSGSLCLQSISCALRAPQGVPELEADQPLLAFSVPAELAAAPEWEACRGAWQARLLQQHHSAVQQGLPWSELQLAVVSQRPGPVAL